MARFLTLALAPAVCGGCQDDEPYERRCTLQPDGDGLPAPAIRFDPTPRLFTEPFDLTVSAAQSGVLRYTTNGCPPDGESSELRGALRIDSTVEVRVALFPEDTGEPLRASAAYLARDPLAELQSNLPLVVVETWGQEGIDDEEGPRPHRPAYLFVIEPGEGGHANLQTLPALSERIGIHIRGNSSSEEYPKKQYKVETWGEFDDDLDRAVLGMPSESDWVLHAPHSDKTFMRNHLVYGWSNRVGRWAPRTRFVETLIDRDGTLRDDDYAGLYVWMEKIKIGDNRIDLDKLEPSDVDEPAITGGYLLARDWGAEEHGFHTATYDDWLLIESPKPDAISGQQRSYIEGYIDAFEAALAGQGFDDPDSGYAAYIDTGSFIDHHLLVELARDVDGFVLSTFMHKPRDGKLAMGSVWDFNGALGNADYFDAEDPEGWHHENDEFPGDNPHGYRWYERLFEDPAFEERYAERWRELRAGPLSDEMLVQDIDATASLLSDAAQRNFERWPILGQYVWPNDDGHADRVTYDAEVDYLRQWLLTRAQWMDGELTEG